MKTSAVLLGVMAVSGTAGAAITAFPSTFAGAFGDDGTNIIGAQPVNLDAQYIRKRLATTNIASFIETYEGRDPGSEAGLQFRTNSWQQSIAEPPNRSEIEVQDDETVRMSIFIERDHVLDITADIQAVNPSRSNVDLHVKFNHDWLSDTGEILPGDLARLEAATELMATEYVLSRLQRRPMAKSEEDLTQIYGAATFVRVLYQIGTDTDAMNRIEAGVRAKYDEPRANVTDPFSPDYDPQEAERYYADMERRMARPRYTPGENFAPPQNEAQEGNWGN